MNNGMVCDMCKKIQKKKHADRMAGESISEYTERLENLGYYGDDTHMVFLEKCHECSSYYKKYSIDNFETGGGVSESIMPIDKNEVIEIIKMILEKFKDRKDQWSISIVNRLKKELGEK